MLKYTGHQTACDAAFVAFLFSWILTRHYLLCKIIWASIVANPFYVSPSRNDSWIFILMLCALEGLICIWSFAIARVLWSILNGSPADDVRSDSEAESTPSKPATPVLEGSTDSLAGLNDRKEQ